MSQNLSLYEDALQFYLIISTDTGELSESMQFAREKLEENISKGNIKNITPTECIELSGNFTKKHLVVFDEFGGECFEAIKKTQAIILGPRCVISCMMDNVSLPYIISPMFNLSMRDLVICLSSFDPQEKEKLRTLIGYMGGFCIEALAEKVTHLVTESVRTKKYEAAVKLKMNIMKATWVTGVWDESATENLLATSQRFESHKVPAFYKLRVTTTGLLRKEKKEVEEMVIAGGGTYYGEFSSSLIDVVIAKRDATETQKLKAAINQKKDCLCVEWIRDSAKQNVALPLDNYRINLQAKKHTSTPEKRPNVSHFNNTQATGIDISNIHLAGTINETAMSNLSICSDVGANNRKRKSNDAGIENKDLSYKITFDKLNIQDAKRAGTFLDGCNIFICGFSTEEKEKIVKILNAGGATRYDTINSNLSHILVGAPTKKDLTMLQAVSTDATLVKLEWILESIKQKSVADCDRFIYQLNAGKSNAVADESAAAPSPASKRNILLMSGQTPKQGTPKRLNFNDQNSPKSKDQSPNQSTSKPQHTNNEIDDALIDQYLQAPAPPAPIPARKEPEPVPPMTTRTTTIEPVAGPSNADAGFKVPAQPAPRARDDSESDRTDLDSEQSEFSSAMASQVTFLNKLKVYIRGFDEESQVSLVEDCKLAGADVIEDNNYTGEVDLLILPVDAMTMEGIVVKPKCIVNHNWLINAKQLYEIDANTKLTAITDPNELPYFYKPIFFPEELAPLANIVIVFSLYSSDERNFLSQLAQILGATAEESYCRTSKPLLICPEARSAKYDAAIRWRLTVVNRNWLMECYKQKRRVPLRNYLVGQSIVSVDHQFDEEDDEILSSQPQHPIPVEPRAETSREPPALTNRRVEQLRGDKPKSTPESPLTPAGSRDYLKLLDTPTRESLLQRFKEFEEETPQSKRRRCEQAGIFTPEEATTPYWREFKRQQLEERRTRHAPTQEQLDKIQKKTPPSEARRSFWKSALGDEYESPSQCYSLNMQKNAAPSANDSIASRPSGRHLNFESQAETEADDNIRMLADFIKQGKQGKNSETVSYVDLPNTALAESEMINTEPLEVIGWRDPSETVDSTPKRNVKVKGVPCFSISCSSEEVKNLLIKRITSLNGKVCENLVKYDSKCTHFVCEKPSRSEKMMSCIAAGKWVLGLSYIHKSYEANHFLEEEEFEWGNPKATNLPQMDDKDLGVAKAAFRWRKKFQSIVFPSAKGIFKDFRVILKTTKDEGLGTLIEAGRGKIIDVNKDLPLDKQSEILSKATHIICQQNHTKFTADELKAIDQAKIHCVSTSYLQMLILNENTPDVKNHLFKQNKA